jgi:hypothetical protein
MVFKAAFAQGGQNCIDAIEFCDPFLAGGKPLLFGRQTEGSLCCSSVSDERLTKK